tara:strand:- start:22 stop:648 length:627 start_codon:yes stop_codon:yes gene_type:complete
MDNDIQLVVFDLFGTLLQTGSGHNPYRKVLEWARLNGRAARPNDARIIMTSDMNPEELFDAMDITPTAEIMSLFKKALEADIKSIRLFDDAMSTLHRLTDQGVQIAICSNLAKPYGAALELIGGVDFLRCLSFEIGAIKPDPAVYNFVTNSSSIGKENILFIGDSLVADYDGSKQFGFRARHLVRGVSSTPTAPNEYLISSLSEILKV